MSMHVALIGSHPLPGQAGRGGVERVVEVLRQKLAERVRVSLIVPNASQAMRWHDGYGDVIYLKRPAGPGFLSYCTTTSSAIRRCLEHIRPDLVHVHDMAGFALLWAERRHNLPMVFTAHGVLEFDVRHAAQGDLARRVTAPLRSAFISKVERKSRLLYDDIIVINDYILDVMPEVASLRHHCIANPVDEIFFRSASHERRDRTKFRLLQVGVIGPRKNITGSIALIHEMLLNGVNVHLDVVGPVIDERYYYECIEEAQGRGITSAVTFHGNASPPEVATWMDRSDILLLLSKQETSPMVVAEAHCRGLPVAVPRAFGLRSMVSEPINGIFLGEGGAGSDARRIERFLSDPVDRDRIREEALYKYELSSIIDRTLNVYRGAIRGKTSCPVRSAFLNA